MPYGRLEFLYAEPFAKSLENDAAFRSWVLRKTKFAKYADQARLLHDELLAKRSPGTQTWWRSHYRKDCACFGCRGAKESRETDLLAIFEADIRFALHVEVKHPADSFDDDEQARAYPIRAECWAGSHKTPRRVLPHTDATTVLLFSELQRCEYAPHLPHFAAKITFEEIKELFPNATI